MSEEPTPQLPRKRGRTLSEEEKAKMKAGRQAAAARRKAAAEEGLVRTNSAEVRAKQAGRVSSLEEVAARHAAPAPPALTPEEIAERTEVVDRDLQEYTSGAAVPPDEPDPYDRDAATIGDVYELRDESDDELYTLADLMTEYGRAIDLGQAYIYVDRKFPTSFEGVRIKGVQKPIRQQMTQEEFNSFYGNGTYELIVYGPSKQKGYAWDPHTGQYKHRKLTKPIRMDVPMGYPPNPTAMFQEEDDIMMTEMRGAGRLPLRGATSADAKMHETDVQANERREERLREEERERKEAEAAKSREADRMVERLMNQVNKQHEVERQQMREMFDRQLDAVKENASVQMDSLRGEIDRLMSELERERREPKKNDGAEMVNSFNATLGQLMPAMMKSNEITADQRHQLEAAAREDRERLETRHREELQRVQDAQRASDDRWRQLIDDERRRSEDRVRETREQADNRVREAEQRAQTQIDATRSSCDQRLQDMKSSFETRISDMDRHHQQELRQKNDNFEARIESIKSGHQAELSVKEAELVRMREELETARQEAKKSLAERLEEQEEIAAAMGFVKADEAGEKDWKTTVAEMGTHVFQNIPSIIDMVNRTMEQRRLGAGAPPPRQLAAPNQAPSRMNGHAAPPPGRPLAFATEDGPDFDFGPEGPSEPIYPNAPPTGPSRRPVPLDGSAPKPSRTPAEPPPPPPPAPAAAAAPPPAQEPNPPAQPSSAEPQGMVTEQQVVQYSSLFSDAFSQGATPEEFTQHIVQGFGPDMVRQVARSLQPEQVIEILNRNASESPLLRRAGQKFLRDAHQLMLAV